ncbi:hypothetical protein D3C86_1256440 [compost metagenome]
MSTPSFLVNARAIRSSISPSLLQPKVDAALETLEMPRGWFKQRSQSSVLFTRDKRRLPHVKVYFDKYRVDVDQGSGCNVKSTRQEFGSAGEMAAYVQSQFWKFSQ